MAGEPPSARDQCMIVDDEALLCPSSLTLYNLYLHWTNAQDKPRSLYETAGAGN